MPEAQPASRAVPLLITHLAAVLFGFAGVLGKGLALPATVIVWGRAGFAAVALALCLPWEPGGMAPPSLRLLISGGVLAAHWVTFFLGIQRSSVALGLLAFATFPIVTMVGAGWLLGEPVRRRDGLAGLLSLGGVAMLVPGGPQATGRWQGIAWGLVSAVLFAVLVLVNRRSFAAVGPIRASFWQNAMAAMVLTPVVWQEVPRIGGQGWLGLLAMGVVLTAAAHTLFLVGVRRLPATQASLIAAMEPAYGILAAYLWLGDVPETMTLVGGLAIVMGGWLASGRSEAPSPHPADFVRS